MFQRLRHQQRLILSSNGNMRGLSRPVLPLVYNSSSRSLNCFSSTVSGTSTHSKFSSFFLPSSMSASYSSSTTAPTASRMSPMRMRSLFAHVVDKTHGEVTRNPVDDFPFFRKTFEQWFPKDEHKLLLVGSSLLGTGLDSDLDLVCVMRHPKPDQVLIKILTQQEAELGEASPWVLANRAQLKRGGGPKNSRSTVKLRHRPSGIEADIMFFCLDSRGAGVKMSEVGPLDLLHMLNKQSIRPRANPNNSVAHVAGQAPVILKVAEEYGLLTELRTLMKFIRVLFRGAGLRPHQNGYICNGGSDAIGLDVLIKLKQKYEDALARGEKPPLVTVLDAYIGFLTVLTNDLDKYSLCLHSKGLAPGISTPVVQLTQGWNLIFHLNAQTCRILAKFGEHCLSEVNRPENFQEMEGKRGSHPYSNHPLTAILLKQLNTLFTPQIANTQGELDHLISVSVADDEDPAVFNNWVNSMVGILKAISRQNVYWPLLDHNPPKRLLIYHNSTVNSELAWLTRLNWKLELPETPAVIQPVSEDPRLSEHESESER